VEGCDVVQYPEDFLLAQDAGQSSLSFGVQIVKDMPFSPLSGSTAGGYKKEWTSIWKKQN